MNSSIALKNGDVMGTLGQGDLVEIPVKPGSETETFLYAVHGLAAVLWFEHATCFFVKIP